LALRLHGSRHSPRHHRQHRGCPFDLEHPPAAANPGGCVMGKIGRFLPGALLTLYVVIATLGMLLPIVIVLGTSLSPRAFLEFPPSGIDFKWYAAVLSNASWTGSLVL